MSWTIAPVGRGDNKLYSQAGTPSLDLRFASTKSLNDYVTGKNLIEHTRASRGGTYVGSDGLIKTAVTNYFTDSEDMQSAFSIKAGVQSPMPSDTSSGPFSGTFADEMRETATTGGHYIERNTGQASNNTWTYSAYVKRINNPRVVWLTLYANGYADNINGQFNLDTLFTQATDGGTGSAIDSSITPIGNGWFRLSVTGIPSTASVNDLKCRIVLINASTIYTGDGTSGIYLWGAQLEQSDTVGEYVKTTSTINSAPRFDHKPIISSNLLPNSEEFSPSYWNVDGITPAVATSIVAPLNGATASLFTETQDNSAHRLFDTLSLDTRTHTLSIFVKNSSGTRRFYLSSDDSGGTRRSLFFDLQTQAITSTGGFVDPFIIPYPDGWYRVGGTITSNDNTVLFIAGLSDGTVTTYLGDNTSGVYLWGAQLEDSESVGSYVPTVSGPETSLSTESLGLLVEESRTNLLLQSNGFDTTWTESSSSITAASGTAPDGTNTAWELKDTVDGGPTPHAIVQSYTGWTSGTTYTFSCWMKAGTLTEGGFIFTSAVFGAVLNARFNLTTGALISASTGVTASSVLYPNGWVRVIATATATATDTGNFSIRIMDGSTSYQGDGTGTILIWGAQLEAGSFPTSYIPTTSSTVTRAADVASISGSNFSSWYRQDEGTVFADAASTRGALIGFSDGTSTERYRIVAASTALAGFGTSGGSTQFNFNTGLDSWISPDSGKGALGLKLNNFFVVANGNYTATDPSGTPPNVDRLFIGNAHINSPLNGHLRRLTYWPQRLPDSALVNITS